VAWEVVASFPKGEFVEGSGNDSIDFTRERQFDRANNGFPSDPTCLGDGNSWTPGSVVRDNNVLGG
jgi:hypothetical protein